ncbi:MAG: hypothetical protein LR015_13510 [Verrucomicrobia bacterium]|nr:hypothetical protein [Verrucomicrobiota bacterium]
MSHLWILIRHELRVLLVSPSTYIAAVLAVTMMGFLYFIMLMIAMEGPQEQLPPELFFSFFLDSGVADCADVDHAIGCGRAEARNA